MEPLEVGEVFFLEGKDLTGVPDLSPRLHEVSSLGGLTGLGDVTLDLLRVRHETKNQLLCEFLWVLRHLNEVIDLCLLVLSKLDVRAVLLDLLEVLLNEDGQFKDRLRLLDPVSRLKFLNNVVDLVDCLFLCGEALLKALLV